MKDGIRFWGRVQAVKPRLVLTKFGGDTGAKCHGHLLVIDGTRTPEGSATETGVFTVAIGPAALDKRALGAGDLVRGDAVPVPTDTPDTPADLYRVGTFRLLAPASVRPALDRPRSDAPLSPDRAEAAPRRALHPDNLTLGGPCAPCPYGVIVPVVRVSDPRDRKNGSWRHVPACLGPEDCPYYRAPG